MGKHKSKFGLQGGSTVQHIGLQKSSYLTKYGMEIREVPPSPPPLTPMVPTHSKVSFSHAGISRNCFVADTKGPDAPAPGRGGAGAAELPQQGASAASLSSAYVRKDRFYCVYDCVCNVQSKRGKWLGPAWHLLPFPCMPLAGRVLKHFKELQKDGTKIFGRKSVLRIKRYLKIYKRGEYTCAMGGDGGGYH